MGNVVLQTNFFLAKRGAGDSGRKVESNYKNHLMLIHILLTCQPIRPLETYPPQKQGFNSRHYYRKLMVNGSISP